MDRSTSSYGYRPGSPLKAAGPRYAPAGMYRVRRRCRFQAEMPVPPEETPPLLWVGALCMAMAWFALLMAAVLAGFWLGGQ